METTLLRLPCPACPKRSHALDPENPLAPPPHGASHCNKGGRRNSTNEKVQGGREAYRSGPRETLVALSWMTVTSSTRATPQNKAASSASDTCFSTYPTKELDATCCTPPPRRHLTPRRPAAGDGPCRCCPPPLDPAGWLAS
jgi:hypothetical protein